MKKIMSMLLIVMMCLTALSVLAIDKDATRWSVRGTEGSRTTGDYTKISAYMNNQRRFQSQGSLIDVSEVNNETVRTSISWNTRNAADLIQDTATKTKIKTTVRVIQNRQMVYKPAVIVYYRNAGTFSVKVGGVTYSAPVINRFK